MTKDKNSETTASHADFDLKRICLLLFLHEYLCVRYSGTASLPDPGIMRRCLQGREQRKEQIRQHPAVWVTGSDTAAQSDRKKIKNQQSVYKFFVVVRKWSGWTNYNLQRVIK